MVILVHMTGIASPDRATYIATYTCVHMCDFVCALEHGVCIERLLRIYTDVQMSRGGR